MRSYAIVPAAGQSRRLGGNKLLLPYRGTSLLACVLQAWTRSLVSRVVVVLRSDDQRALAIARQAGVEIVCAPERVADMKASVQLGLRSIEAAHKPQGEDVWLLAPADMPRLTADDVNRVLAAHDPHEPEIVVPQFGGQTGHPVLLPWATSQRVFQLGMEEGINTLVRGSQGRRLVPTSPGCLDDIDTPLDYQRLLAAGPRLAEAQHPSVGHCTAAGADCYCAGDSEGV